MLAALMPIPSDEMLKQEDILCLATPVRKVIMHDSTVHSGRTYSPISNRIPTGTVAAVPSKAPPHGKTALSKRASSLATALLRAGAPGASIATRCGSSSGCIYNVSFRWADNDLLPVKFIHRAAHSPSSWYSQSMRIVDNAPL